MNVFGHNVQCSETYAFFLPFPMSSCIAYCKYETRGARQVSSAGNGRRTVPQRRRRVLPMTHYRRDMNATYRVQKVHFPIPDRQFN